LPVWKPSDTLYNSNIIRITRKIPLNPFKTRGFINKKTGLTLEVELLEYCNEPRYINEITKFLGLENKDMANGRFTTPLIKEGKLKFIYPESPKCIHQRYLKADIEYTEEMQARAKELEKTDRHLEMEKMALEFCKEPRNLGEIKDHVGLVGYDIVRKRVVQPLIDDGKIKLIYPHNPLYRNQRYVVVESDEGYDCFDENGVIAYCQIPRSMEDIEEHFGIGQDLLYKVVRPLIKQNKLIYTKSTRVGNKIIKPKLIKNDSPQTPIIKKTKPTENDIISFCETPRFVYEVIKEFGINDYTARKMTNKLLDEGKLIHTGERRDKRHRKLIKNG